VSLKRGTAVEKLSKGLAAWEGKAREPKAAVKKGADMYCQAFETQFERGSGKRKKKPQHALPSSKNGEAGGPSAKCRFYEKASGGYGKEGVDSDPARAATQRRRGLSGRRGRTLCKACFGGKGCFDGRVRLRRECEVDDTDEGLKKRKTGSLPPTLRVERGKRYAGLTQQGGLENSIKRGNGARKSSKERAESGEEKKFRSYSQERISPTKHKRRKIWSRTRGGRWGKRAERQRLKKTRVLL